jgi:hypothetical protein
MIEAKPGESQSVRPETTSEEGRFAHSRTHTVLASIATSRWSRLFGYGVLIVACRVVRTIIRA